MTRKMMLALLLLALPLSSMAAEDENITDIKEQSQYAGGEYKAGTEGNTLTVKKGEGFDFKVPEIMITGQVDTKVLLSRDVNLLEDFKGSKDILKERSRLYVPDSYVKDEEVMKGRMQKSPEKDFVGNIKLHGGSYNTLFGSLIVGRVFDQDNNAVANFTHISSEFDSVNERVTSRAENSLKVYYRTKYDFIDAMYSLKGALNIYGNPFPDNALTGSFNSGAVAGQAAFSGRIKDVDLAVLVKYDYFDQTAKGPSYIYKENRFTNRITAEKNFTVDAERKVKTIGALSWHTAEIYGYGERVGSALDIDLNMLGIFYFEPIVFQGGLRFQDYSLKENYYRISPFFNFTYDINGAISAYVKFAPEMKAQDSMELLSVPFTALNAAARPAVESVDVRGGFNVNAFSVFADIYGGFAGIKDALNIDDPDGDGLFCAYNTDYETPYAGVRLETLKIKNFSAAFSYEYRGIMNAKEGSDVTGVPANKWQGSVIFEKYEWKAEASVEAESGAFGKTNGYRPAFTIINVSLERSLTDYLTLYGYANNILNNNRYLLYYYKEKGFNVGLGAVLNF